MIAKAGDWVRVKDIPRHHYRITSPGTIWRCYHSWNITDEIIAVHYNNTYGPNIGLFACDAEIYIPSELEKLILE